MTPKHEEFEVGMRRLRFLAAAALTGVTVTCGLARATPAARPVPHQPITQLVDEADAYQANPAHTGQSGAVLRLPLHIRWIRNVGAQYYTSPVIAGGKIAVSAGFSVIALSAASGNVLWSSPSPEGWSGLAQARGVVYAAQTFGGPLVAAFDFSTGRTLWSQAIPNPDAIDPPVVAGNVVYVAGGAPTTLYALRAQDGAPLWSEPVTFENFGTTPTVANGRVYVSYECDGTYAFTLAGLPIWHFPGACSGVSGSAPAFYQGKLYVQATFETEGTVLTEGTILNAFNGALLGTFGSNSSPAFAAGLEFVASGSGLQALNAATSGISWTASIGNDSFITPPLVVGNLVFAEGQTGTLYAFDFRTGQLLQSIALGAPIYREGGFLPVGLAAAQGILVAPAGNYVAVLSGS